MKLGAEHIRFFRQAGYLRLPLQLPAEMIEAARAAVAEDIREGKQPCSVDEQGRINRLSRLTDRVAIFREMFTFAPFLDSLESLLGPNIELLLNRHNHATLNFKNSGPQRLHRDVLQWSRTVLTALMFLEASTVENGCTHIVPCSHFLPFVGKPNNGGTWMDEHEVFADLLDQAVPVPMTTGGILLLDSLAFHAAGNNTTDTNRMCLAAAYHSVDELSGERESPHRLLVRGERIYRGNDRY